jgi:murein L,D-transpeptidase YcbB/YkuD
VAATAVALIAGVWLRLAGTITPAKKHGPDLAAHGDSDHADARAPASPALIELRRLLPEHTKRANRDDRAAMTAFYEERSGPLIWVTDTGISHKARAAIAEMRKADDWGLRSSDFAMPQLAAGDLSPEAAAEAEITLTLALLKYARFARGGRIADPSRISKLLDHTPPVRPPKLVLADIAAADAPDAYLRSLHPKHEQFEKLRQLLLKLRNSDARAGIELEAKGTEIVFGAKLQETQSERSSGQPTTADPSVASRIDRILVNMERWRWMPVDLGTLYVWSNVPEFLTRVVKDGRIINSDRIVAGQPEWPTPAFSADMKTIVFHPSWGVPDGIKRKELAPLLRSSSGGGLIGLFTGAPSSQAVLDAHNLRAYHRGRPIDPNQVDWSSANIGAYDFRQPPGPKNVLGAIKFMFPNKHDVYMHDTPERDLFARPFRGLSHGCMRVGDPRRLAEILLAEDKGWPAAKVGSMFNGGSQEVALSTHIPVHVTYFTAMVDYQGNLRTFGDLYGLDARVGTALLGRKVRFETPRYDAELMAVQQQQRRRQAAQSQGPSTLADAISDIFSP